MRRIAATTTAAALGMVVALAPQASAGAAETTHGSPWTPYRTEEVTVTAARSTCAFDVRITPLVDREEYRTVSTWPDGTPKAQIYRGTLIERYTNLSSNDSVVRDLSATALFRFNQDGTPASLTSAGGPFGTTMPAGSRPNTGLYVLSGVGTTVTFNADGTRSYYLGYRGQAENVCDALD